jgi:hypothetical protein
VRSSVRCEACHRAIGLIPKKIILQKNTPKAVRERRGKVSIFGDI